MNQQEKNKRISEAMLDRVKLGLPTGAPKKYDYQKIYDLIARRPGFTLGKIAYILKMPRGVVAYAVRIRAKAPPAVARSVGL